MFKMIAATDSFGCAGLNNKLPWHYPEDLKYFQAVTMGCPVIMGHNTFKSIQSYGMSEGFKGRKNIVITSDPELWTKYLQPELDVIYVSGISAAKSAAMVYSIRNSVCDMWVVGGKSIYEAFMEDDSVTEFHWSVVGNGKEFEGDTYIDFTPIANRLGLTGTAHLSDDVYVNLYRKEE